MPDLTKSKRLNEPKIRFSEDTRVTIGKMEREFGITIGEIDRAVYELFTKKRNQITDRDIHEFFIKKTQGESFVHNSGPSP